MEDVKNIHAQELGKLGGSVKSLKKTEACRRNGSAPCHPGKKRGRPFKKKVANV